MTDEISRVSRVTDDRRQKT